MRTLLASVSLILLTAQVSHAAISVREADGQFLLYNGKLGLAVARDGSLSATTLHDEKSVPILFSGRPGIFLSGSARIEFGRAAAAKSREVQTGLGSGKLVELTFASKVGTLTAEYALYDGELFTAELSFTPAADIRISRMGIFSAQLDLGQGEVRSLTHDRMWEATVDILAQSKRSQFFTALDNRESKLSAIVGALTATAETTIEIERGKTIAHLAAFTQYSGPGAGELRLRAGQTARSGPVAIVLPADILTGLEAYGAAVRQFNHIQPYRPIPAGWCSWDAYGNGVTEKDILNTLDAIRKLRLREFGFNTLQIDDGWQRGWRCSGDWRYNPERFPHGIKPLAEAAQRDGLALGLWIGPFSDEDTWNKPKDWPKSKRKDPIDFPELTVHNDRGEPTGAYDLSNPKYREHLTKIIHQMTADWGANYIKADFLAWGYGVQADKSLPHHDIFRSAIRSMRDGMPAKTYFMTCINHEWKSLGLADGQRIGNDVGQDWKGLEPTLRCAAPLFFTNGNFWWNDPDQLHISGSMDRQGKLRGLTLDQARAWATLVALCGGVTMTGDRLTDLPPERVKLLTQTLPPTGQTARPLDLFDALTRKSPQLHSSVWDLPVVKPFGNYHVVALFNWTTTEAERTVPLAELGFSPADRVVIYDFWRNELVTSAKGGASFSVPATSCRLLVLHRATGQPQFLSSDRHLTAGLIDVIEYHYDANTRTLAGKSARLVPGVPFRYSFFIPDGLNAISATIDGKGAQIQTKANLLTVTFTPSRPDTDWQVDMGQ